MTNGLSTSVHDGSPPSVEKLNTKKSALRKQVNQNNEQPIVSLIQTQDILKQVGMTSIIEKFREHHHQYVASARSALLHALSCGHSLTIIRTSYGHTQWTEGYKRDLELVLGVGLRTAERYMKLYGDFQDFAFKNNVEASAPEQDAFYLQLIENFKASKSDEKQSLTTDPNDWTTPNSVFAAAQRLVGQIDTDPCGMLETDLLAYGAQEKTIFATDFDGLGGLSPQATWDGRVWIAPGHIGDLPSWCNKVLDQFRCNVMTTGLLLLPVEAIFSQPPLHEFPVAVLSSPLTVQVRRLKKQKDGVVATIWKPRVMPKAFGVCLLSRDHKVDEFAAAFRDIAVVFVSVAASHASLPRCSVTDAVATESSQASS